MRPTAVLVLWLSTLTALAGAEEARMTPVPTLDLRRYAGVWYEIARLADPKGPPSQLKVRFAPAFLSFLSAVWGDYWVIDLARDYSYAVVGEPERKYLWVLSRTPRMPEPLYAEILERAARLYDASRIVRTEQLQSPAPAP